MTKHSNTLLCLGDSYTIGEGVPLHESFPYQLVQLLREKGLHFQAPEIVAQTGWTSFELAEHLLHTHLNEHYDFVTLLIGVNNQYRNLSLEDFKTDLDFLIKKAIHLTGDKNERVIVLSIPDWGFTPYAKHKNTTVISEEINDFNTAVQKAAQQHHTQFISITEASKKVKEDETLLAKDHLHYSGKAMYNWALDIADTVVELLK
ncbi:MAG: SGNH/GDSL hydrolase family protein [Bacteroidota bacterium]|nr:SGNH/GDSL hydrolase family protein [Bacteroidota bacterium]